MVNYPLQLIKNYLAHYSGLERIVWRGIFLSFVESGFIGIYYFLAIYFTDELGYNIATAGIILSFFGFGTILGGYAGGKLSDYYSAEVVCINSLFLQALVFLVLIKLKSITMLSVDVFLMGFLSYIFITSNHLWVLERCADEKNRLKALNLLNTASNLALAFSGIIFGYVVFNNYSLMFKIGSVILFILASYLLFFRIKENKLNLHSPHNKTLLPIKEKNKSKFDKVIFLTFLFSFLMGFIIFQTTTYSIYLKNAFPSLGVKSFSILLSINCFMVVFLQTPLINTLGKYNKITIMGLGGFLIGFGMALLPFSYSFLIAIISCVIYTIGEMMFCSIAQLVCYENSGEGKKGEIMGIYRTIYASSRVVAPLLGGIIFEQLSGNMLWYFCGILGSITLGICSYYSYLLK